MKKLISGISTIWMEKSTIE